ncbi:MAG TPA: hypothetical protein VHT52_17890 [Stellaceae bacterium]|jgi:Holliday junction resolvase|nr:hypothetical protein [Stellaceae bacterium]
MSGAQRAKGARLEREIVELHKAIGVDAERVPLSGASHYRGGGHDVDVYAFGKDAPSLVGEIKGRAKGQGFTMLERWLGELDLLFLRRDRAKPLVVMTWDTYERLLQCTSQNANPSTRPNFKNGHPVRTSGKPGPNVAKDDADGA